MYNCASLTGLPGVGCGGQAPALCTTSAMGSIWGRGVSGVVQDDKFDSRAKMRRDRAGCTCRRSGYGLGCG